MNQEDVQMKQACEGLPHRPKCTRAAGVVGEDCISIEKDTCTIGNMIEGMAVNAVGIAENYDACRGLSRFPLLLLLLHYNASPD